MVIFLTTDRRLQVPKFIDIVGELMSGFTLHDSCLALIFKAVSEGKAR
ncbi:MULTISPECIES: hypothetical protein [unclassified Tolypothrix]|nr:MULTISPECIES: hypothetical protein [unclassified Tolypothrix]BAY92668.1 hypothetical protein NIES3275_47050 [Microchaete diplosiphon NIES-3275]EKF05768.1 hypothetical protein FDUTEX481_00625 [Tolypothrix sp. PCC 7601]MBE9087690.1 hypothetical protein [Tolypothrix sp. LEGE 11397]UYD26607.1 hypothetical protein HGR01_00280 [Tolypothrix sp. PCC 7712]UYD37537.1 hypothetical protein HG267_18540 [Tolypothrix sp. PCC 7601]